MTINPYNEDERLEVMMACSYAAVKSGFSHLALRDIINPPHAWFDAALARQIAIHILNTVFDVPRRRLVTMMGRQRCSISFAVRSVDARLEHPVFEAAYKRMARRALDLFDKKIMKDAA
ncbi:hypothetical protein ASD64_07280 [Mesorhizobium sp. Root157]|uniref:hypothetical protein n=1 Tax=Mesorhizobium sp. Root157 TaxID=1736477 RepID=UPI0007017D98|nr:hypothetical protein [Mesorhizobium sp. Root157]KQZ87233.1 hypothetical protein ASD64_07280 [Mesorhizobium sp. Root157]